MFREKQDSAQTRDTETQFRREGILKLEAMGQSQKKGTPFKFYFSVYGILNRMVVV